jgi:hypothetical protein
MERKMNLKNKEYSPGYELLKLAFISLFAFTMLASFLLFLFLYLFSYGL